MKKKIIIGVLIIIVLIVGILGYTVISDLIQEDKLKTELTELNDLTNAEKINMDEINNRLDRIVTTGDYAKVEKAFKTYLSDNFDNSIEITNLINDDRITTLLTFDNYKTDGKEFNESKIFIKETKEKLEECKNKYSEFMTKDKAMSYIDDKGLDSYYIDLYEKDVVGDMDSIKDTTVEDSIDEIISLLNISEEILNLLSKNQDTWNLVGDNILFSNDSIRGQYDNLVNSIG